MIAAPTLVGCGLRLFLNFRLGQVAGEQEVALDGADVRRPLVGDPERVVGKEIEIAGQLRRPFDRLDIALEHLDANHGAVGIELLHRDDCAREHVAVCAVFGGDAPGDVVDRLQRDLVPDEIGVELGELRAGVDGRALDADFGAPPAWFRPAPGGASMQGTRWLGRPAAASGTAGRSNRSRSRPG